MSLYSDWENLSKMHRSQEEHKDYWDAYFQAETEIYEKILNKLDEPYSGTLKVVAEELDIEQIVLTGFIDGANESLKAGEYNLDELEEESEILLEMDLDKLYYNMLDAKADWLYTLPQWDDIFSIEERKEIKKQFQKDNIFIAEKKPLRNDPCPCGNGKKYKACHGKPGSEPLS